MNSPDRTRLAFTAAAAGSGFALAYGAVTGNPAVLVTGVVLLVLGPLRYFARRRGRRLSIRERARAAVA
jgi:hypothetical protein